MNNLEKMREMTGIQGRDGTWDYDSYMHGLYNGMEYNLALAENRRPIFREPPKRWLCDRKCSDLSGEEFSILGGDSDNE